LKVDPGDLAHICREAQNDPATLSATLRSTGGKRLSQVAELSDHYEHAARTPQPIRFAFLRLG
jgi:hypothetical protein